MTLRNGDRSAFSKPLALRTGDATVLEVLAIRRDGFDGDIDLKMEGLPAGVSATGLKIPAGKSVGTRRRHRRRGARSPGFPWPRSPAARQIGDQTVTRPCRFASMEWPVKDAKQEIPAPRLVSSVPVSVSDSEAAPLSFSAAEDKTWEVDRGRETEAAPEGGLARGFHRDLDQDEGLRHRLRPAQAFEIPLKAETHEVELDLAALKAKPGEYTIAFYGGGIAKYRYNPKAGRPCRGSEEKGRIRSRCRSCRRKQRNWPPPSLRRRRRGKPRPKPLPRRPPRNRKPPTPPRPKPRNILPP